MSTHIGEGTLKSLVVIAGLRVTDVHRNFLLAKRIPGREIRVGDGDRSRHRKADIFSSRLGMALEIQGKANGT